MTPEDVLAPGILEAELVANAGDAFIVADADGIIRFWNPAAETMFGYSADEAIGETLDIIVPEPQRKAHWDGYFKTMASGETKYGGTTLSVPAMRADGTRLSVAFTVALLHEPDGKVAGIGAVMRDVTGEWEQKKSSRRRIAELEQELSALRERPSDRPAEDPDSTPEQCSTTASGCGGSPRASSADDPTG